MNLKQVRLNDLYGIIGSIAPKDLPDIKAIRKINGALEALEKVAKPYLDKISNLQIRINKVIIPFREKLKLLEGKTEAKSESQRKKLLEEGQELINPFNEELKKLEETEGQAEVELELDPNYLDQVKIEFAKSKDKFNSMKAFIEICDALGITE